MAPKIAIVTGSNKGIGFHIVRLLKEALGADSRVVLCSRDEARGQEAVAELRAQGIEAELGILDIADQESVDRFAAWVSQQYGRVDYLINNAGFAFKGAATEPFPHQARYTIDINYYGTLRITRAIKPLMPRGSRIVNVSSTAGLLKILSPELQERFTAPDLTEEQLSALLEDFVRLTQTDEHRAHGWPNSAYGTSKVGMSALTRVHARLFESDGITVNACCPGWCRTDMAGDKAPRSAEQGARTPVWLAVTDGVGTGKFFADEQERTW